MSATVAGTCASAAPRGHIITVRSPREELPRPDLYFAHHSKSFSFAAAFMGREDRERIARVYAWCRYTDDIVDDCDDPVLAEARLDRWLELSRSAFDGRRTGVALLDTLMPEMASRGVSFGYAADLVRGVRTDLRPVRLDDMRQLDQYAHLVAGVVGQWLAELHGARDPWMQDRAARLGRAMQLTNILRDVGEDLDRGRLYLPLEELERVGLRVEDIAGMRAGTRRVNDAYRQLIEELMRDAQADYERAREAIPLLPNGFGRAVTVAATVYEAIHDAIRHNDYDNLTRRAMVPKSRKLTLAARALAGSIWRANAVASA